MSVVVGWEQLPCLCGNHDADMVLAAPDRQSATGDPTRYQLVKCRSCGLHFVNPRPVEERLAEFYPETYYAYQNRPVPPAGPEQLVRRVKRWSDRAIRKAFFGYPVSGGAAERWLLRLALWPVWLRMRLLGKDLKVAPYAGQGRFLDVGCGTGHLLVYHRQFGLTVGGVEPSESSAQFARDQLGLDVRTGTLEQAGYEAQAFDIIHLSHVFEHLPNPASTLEELRRVLADDGVLILKVPNMASASAQRFGPWWLGIEMPRHLYHFDVPTLRRLLGRHGFRVERVRQDLGAWGFWRESWRLRAAEAAGAAVPDPWWLAGWSQLAELAACMAGRGSAVAVYARKAERI